MREVSGLTEYSKLMHELLEQIVVNAGVKMSIFDSDCKRTRKACIIKLNKNEQKRRVGQLIEAFYDLKNSDLFEAQQNENGIVFSVRLTWKFQKTVKLA